MKAVILAGGYGTRISEESQLKPKPMIRNRWNANFMAYNENLFKIQN